MTSNFSSTIDPNFLPNLPGFRQRSIPNGTKKHYFQLIGGQVILKDNQTKEIKYEEEQSMIATIGVVPPKTSRFSVSGETNLTLSFGAYFEQRLDDFHPAEVRQCTLYYYTEDNSIKIVEKPQPNSGMVQGTIVRRQVIYKHGSTPITDRDLYVGSVLDVFGRQIK